MSFTNSPFQLVKQQFIQEINTQANLYIHTKTNASLLSLENDDENKVFGVTFRTPPKTANGIAHILEHSVLCGSQKYPIKEPFVELIKGSLKTFLNAFTFPDKTCYPVASQNKQDFYNLIDVYLDAVFYPILSEDTFFQEGWHFELEDLKSPFMIKGVVYNEMKGAYASPDQILGRKSLQSLFPDNTYSIDSGGDPEIIPSLTYKEFNDFHKTYYHPSNARFFFYGNDDPAYRLTLIDSVIQAFDNKPTNSSIHSQPYIAYNEPNRFFVPYPVNEQENNYKKYLFTMNWLMPNNNDQILCLSLLILSHILIGTPASPLRKALIESGLGEELTGGGLDTDLAQMIFSCGLKGYQKEHQSQIEKLIMDTLMTLEKEGIDKASIEASMNTIEFALRENNTGSFPRGISLMIRSLTTWLYDLDPFAPLVYEHPLDVIKDKLKIQPPYFETLIKEHFLDNKHCTIVILEPDALLEQHNEEAFQTKLQSINAQMEEANIHEIITQTRILKEHQAAPDLPQDLAKIPSLKLSDMDKNIKIVPKKIILSPVKDISEQVEIVHHNLFTNHIAYIDIGFDLHGLPLTLIPYLPLFGRCLLELGTAKEDFVKLTQRIGKETGGIRPSLLFSSVNEKPTQVVAKLFLRAKATPEKFLSLLSILKDILLSTQFDNRERFRQLALETKASLESRLSSSGHQWVNTRLRAKFSLADWIGEQVEGCDYFWFIHQLLRDLDSQWENIHDNLEKIRDTILHRQGLVCNITLDDDNWQQIQPQCFDFINSLPSNPSVENQTWLPSFHNGNEGFIIPTQVNYVGKGINLYQSEGYEHGSISVIMHHLRSTWLWDQIRVQGGAYGGFCSYDRLSGTLTFLSYRDPNLQNTLDIYDKTKDHLHNIQLTQEVLNKTIIGVIGEIDTYQLPDAKGFSSFVRHLIGISDEERQKRRSEVLSTTVKDFHRFSDMLSTFNEQGKIVFISSKDTMEKIVSEKRILPLDVHQLL